MPVKKQKIKRVLVVHGPNLNLLGKREPEIYGSLSLSQINAKLKVLARDQKIAASFFQSNHEGKLIDRIQKNDFDAVLINPAAYTHTSIALRDALLAVGKPFVEVHLSDISKREKFRQHSFFSDVAESVFFGQGYLSYEKGMLCLSDFLLKKGGDENG